MKTFKIYWNDLTKEKQIELLKEGYLYDGNNRINYLAEIEQDNLLLTEEELKEEHQFSQTILKELEAECNKRKE